MNNDSIPKSVIKRINAYRTARGQHTLDEEKKYRKEHKVAQTDVRKKVRRSACVR